MMVRALMGWALAAQAVALMWTGTAHAVAVDAVTTAGYADNIIVDAWIGSATWSGVRRPTVCFNGGGTESAFVLNTSGASLDANSSITMNNDSNYVYYQQTNAGDPGTSLDCAAQVANWEVLTFNGFTLSVITEDGVGFNPDNYVEGPNSSGNNWVVGGLQQEYVEIHGSTITTSLSSDVDYIYSYVSHTSGSIITSSGNDCVQFAASTTFGTVDCGAGTDVHNLGASPPAGVSNCETNSGSPGCQLF